jgi:hypothetical protein
VYLFVQILDFNQGNIQNAFIGGLYFIQFGVHEASHIVFGFLPAIFVAASGSLSEIAFTSLVAFAAFKAKAYFAGIFSLLWVMMAMNSAGIYMADARSQAMPLIGPGDNVQHDWNFVFTQLGWLNADTMIGGSLRVFGDVIGVIALVYGLFLLVWLFMERQEPSAKKTTEN